MPDSASQAFLRELDRKLWTAADSRSAAETAGGNLRSNLDAAVYSRAERDRPTDRSARRVNAGAFINHAVLGLIFLKYVSDSFAERQAEIEARLRNPESEDFLDPEEYPSPGQLEDAIRAELEERDYYIEKNVFWVPPIARWNNLQSSAKLPPGSELKEGSGRLARTYKITSLGKLIDDALEAVEKENPNGAERHRLPRRAARRVRAGARINRKNVLNKNHTQLQIDPASRAERDRLTDRPARRVAAGAAINLAGLIDLIATIPFQHADLHAKEILGHVYEPSGARQTAPKGSPKGERGGAHQYFLGQSSGARWTAIGCPKGSAGGRNQFALAEGKKGGQPSGARQIRPKANPKGWRGCANQYFTPQSIVSLIVEMIEPYQGRVYDPAMGSGGFFVHSERFIENQAERDRLAGRPARRVNAGAFINHGGTIGDIMVFGQESNPTTWRLAAMNMAIRGIDFDFGKEPVDTFTRDQHPDLRADFVMALPSAAARSFLRSHPADRPNGRINRPSTSRNGGTRRSSVFAEEATGSSFRMQHPRPYSFH